MKKKFLERFEIISMAKSSLVVLDRETRKEAYIHRNAFNALEDAEDFRVVNRFIAGKDIPWVEVLIWRAL
jgi:hypothetical protein